MRCERVREKREVAFVQYMEGSAPSNMIEENSGFIWVRRSTYCEMDQSVSENELEAAGVNVEE